MIQYNGNRGGGFLMNDTKTMGSLAEKLMGFVSTTPQHDTNYDIAVAMLKHHASLKSLSIGEIADLCYVSKASISRFCRFMGFDSFREMQESLNQDLSIGTDYSRSFFDKLCADPQAALADYSGELVRNIQATAAPENTKSIPEIATAIANSDRLAFFSHHFLWDIGRHLQNKLIRMDRYVELYLDYGAQLTCARGLQKNDLAIVCSIGGSYPLRYPTIWNAITSTGCNLLVITQNGSSPYWNPARFILNCGVTNRNDVGKYGALLAVDLLTLHYLRQYGRDYF